MSLLDGKTCPVCKQPFTTGDEIFFCNQCGVPHHKSCWQQNNGCATFRCPASARPFSETAPQDVTRAEGCYCIMCGSFVPVGLQYCITCGTKVETPGKPSPQLDKTITEPDLPPSKETGSFCITCGAAIPAGQQQCSKCNESVEVFQPSASKAEKPLPHMPEMIEVLALTEKPAEVSMASQHQEFGATGSWQDDKAAEEQPQNIISVTQKIIMVVLGLVIILLSFLLAKNLIAKQPGERQMLDLQPETSVDDQIALPTEAPTFAVPTRIPILADDFSTNQLGWPETATDTFTIGLQDGRYRIFLPDTNHAMIINLGNSYENYQVEADVQKLDGPEDADYGLLCRYTDTENYYYGAISNQSFWISRMQNGRLTLLGSGVRTVTPDLNPGSSVNHLRLVCNGTNISFYANDVLLMSVDDFTMSRGDFAFYATTNVSGGGLEVAFDNLVVSEP